MTNDTQGSIVEAIHNLCDEQNPVTTAGEIAHHAGMSKQTVLNHSRDIAERKNVGHMTIGQAQVFYPVRDSDVALIRCIRCDERLEKKTLPERDYEQLTFNQETSALPICDSCFELVKDRDLWG